MNDTAKKSPPSPSSPSSLPSIPLDPYILPIEARKRIRALLSVQFEKDVAKALGISVNTVCRALSGMRLTLGTIALINERLNLIALANTRLEVKNK